jgi:hypothetical protein
MRFSKLRYLETHDPPRKGKLLTEEQKEKMSLAAKNSWKKRRLEGNDKCTHTKEWNRKIANSNKGKVRTEEQKKIYAEATKKSWIKRKLSVYTELV